MRFFLAIFLILSPMTALAAGHGEFALTSNKHFYPPELENEALNKKVNFSFQKRKISEVLLILSKIGDFNIILPEGLDPEINITLKNKRIIEAIKDIVEAADLKYKFQGNSLIVSEIDISEAEFEHATILYAKANDISAALNDELFKQLTISQPEHAFKPYAFTNPGSNTITIVGNNEQIQAARDLIKVLDKSRHTKFYKPSYLDAEDIIHLISSKLEAPTINIRELSKNRGIIIKGDETEVAESLKLIAEYDKPRKPLNFYFEILRIDAESDTEHKLRKLQQIFPMAKLHKVNANMAQSVEFTSIADYLYKKYSEVFLLYPTETKLIHQLQFSAKRELLQDKQYSLELANQKLHHIERDDIAGLLIPAAHVINNPKDLRMKMGLNPEDLVLVLVQQQ